MAERTRPMHWFMVAALTALGLLGGCTSEETQRNAQLAQLLTWLVGNYDNSAEAAADAKSATPAPHAPISFVIVPVYAPRLGHHVLYAQEMDADDPRRVMSERLFSFKVDDKRGILETVYTLVEPLRWHNGQANKELFNGILADDVQSTAGCELAWTRAEKRFTATLDATRCHVAGAAIAAQSGAQLTEDSLTLGAYRFRKVR
jgi:hypothetical protein